MTMFLVTLAAMLLVVAGMSVGVIFGRKPLKGSCGGIGQALKEDDYVCDFCGNDESKCEELQQQGVVTSAKTDGQTSLSYDAAREPSVDSKNQ